MRVIALSDPHGFLPYSVDKCDLFLIARVRASQYR